MAVVILPDHETTILARVLGNGQDEMPQAMARYLLAREFSARDKERMHDLVVRNQGDELTTAEKEELFAYARAGTVLSILQAKARRALKSKSK
jgi:hypothetical protein